MKKKTISNNLLKSLNSLPDVRKPRVWTLEQNSAILRFADTKGISAIAETLGIPRETVQRQYKFLLSKVGK